jgi:hypothetical protein
MDAINRRSTIVGVGAAAVAFRRIGTGESPRRTRSIRRYSASS